jgi:predicted permease
MLKEETMFDKFFVYVLMPMALFSFIMVSYLIGDIVALGVSTLATIGIMYILGTGQRENKKEQ